MAVARLVCGDCGGDLAPADVRCPSCGASIEKESAAPAEPAQASAVGAPPPAPVTCGACGQANRGDAGFCSSCGARLASAAGRHSPGEPRAQREGSSALEAKPSRDAKRQKRARPEGKGPSRHRFDAWQIVSVVALLALLGYAGYLLIDSEKSTPPSAGSAPGEGGSTLADVNVQNVDLTPLEDAVRTSPGDPGARLKLANALEDAHRYDRAIEEYKSYLKMKPKDPDARTDLGICYFQEALADSGNRGTLLHDAAAEMETAFNGAPRPHQPSAFNLGIVYLHLNQIGDANRWFRKVVEIDAGSELGKKAQSMLSQNIIPQ
ncbi:MAG TPA: tetratricopeptide repeat protein [Bacteroidota bacterium]|nr:tetratricopeptide repeat protein [Bacteroidota bacterium]